MSSTGAPVYTARLTNSMCRELPYAVQPPPTFPKKCAVGAQKMRGKRSPTLSASPHPSLDSGSSQRGGRGGSKRTAPRGHAEDDDEDGEDFDDELAVPVTACASIPTRSTPRGNVTMARSARTTEPSARCASTPLASPYRSRSTSPARPVRTSTPRDSPCTMQS